MTTMTKNEIFEEYKEEYWKASIERKGELLALVCAVTKMHRKSAIRKFANLQKKGPLRGDARGRKTYYTPDVTAALKDIWEWSSEICGELLFSCVKEQIEIRKRERSWSHSDEATSKLRAMSERTMKRRVAHFSKVRCGKGVSSTSPSLLKEIIPIFDGQWDEVSPGIGQIDTVVHSGASLLGDMAYTLNYTDVRTFWIVPRTNYIIRSNFAREKRIVHARSAWWLETEFYARIPPRHLLAMPRRTSKKKDPCFSDLRAGDSF